MRPLLRSAVALLLLSLPSLLIAASPPAAIHGLVTDAATGKTIQSVEIIVLWTQRVAAGAMQVTAKRIGYQSQVQHVTVPDTGVVTVNFVLKPAGKSVAIQ